MFDQKNDTISTKALYKNKALEHDFVLVVTERCICDGIKLCPAWNFNQCYANLYTVLPMAISLVKTLVFTPNEQAKTMLFFF